ncbi:MAG: hypothetical protein ACFBSC_20300 [Microcoleaceae cyanobacterium]
MTTSPATPETEKQENNPSVSVEDYADRLMDDLFEDVERVLEGGTKLPDDAVPPEFISLKSIKVPQIVLPPVVQPEPVEPAVDPDAALRDANAEATNRAVDRLLLGVAFTSLLATLGLWLATRGGLSRLFAPAPVAQPSEAALNAKAEADGRFADYVERSLKAIEQKSEVDAPVALPVFPGTPPVNNLPTLPVPDSSSSLGADTNNLIAAINRVAEAVQEASDQTASLSNRVLRSLQQQAQQPQTQTPTPGGQTSGTSPNQTEAAQTAEAPNEAAEATVSTDDSSATAPVPQPKALAPSSESAAPPPAATADSSTETAANSADSSEASTPAGTLHTLVGVLELGDRSAALFEVDGVARRIYVGESIAASGWTLVEVVNQEAVIRRNGEVRTIFVGQQF